MEHADWMALAKARPLTLKELAENRDLLFGETPKPTPTPALFHPAVEIGFILYLFVAVTLILIA